MTVLGYEFERLSEFGEEYTVPFIRNKLMTPAQRQQLAAMNYDVSDLLNGRFRLDEADTIEQDFFHPWNQLLGSDIFRLL
jgi:hypothetical protein